MSRKVTNTCIVKREFCVIPEQHCCNISAIFVQHFCTGSCDIMDSSRLDFESTTERIKAVAQASNLSSPPAFLIRIRLAPAPFPTIFYSRSRGPSRINTVIPVHKIPCPPPRSPPFANHQNRSLHQGATLISYVAAAIGA